MALSLLMLARGAAVAGQPVELRYAYGQGSARHRLVSGTMAVGLTGGVFALLVAGLVIPTILSPVDPPIVAINIPIDQPPPIDTPDHPPPRQPDTHVTTMRTMPMDSIRLDGPFAAPFDGPTFPPIADPGFDPGATRIADPPAHVPVLTTAGRDPRFASGFQPDYPAAMIRAEREGVCRVSVTVAPSGRVSAVRQLACDDPAFFRATERQALGHWRFRPATRDGTAIETTLDQTVRFQLPE